MPCRPPGKEICAQLDLKVPSLCPESRTHFLIPNGHFQSWAGFSRYPMSPPSPQCPKLAFSVSVLPGPGWPQHTPAPQPRALGQETQTLPPSLPHILFYLGVPLFIRMLMCAPMWRPQVASASTALGLQGCTAVVALYVSAGV